MTNNVTSSLWHHLGQLPTEHAHVVLFCLLALHSSLRHLLSSLRLLHGQVFAAHELQTHVTPQESHNYTYWPLGSCMLENDPDICIHLPVMVATQEQMNLAQLPLEQRDFCAQHLLKLMKCKRDNWPNFLACKHEKHDWDYCEHQE